MIEAEFLNYNGALVGFSVSGHADAGVFGRDIVCAAVSSAVMLTANIITDFLYCKADVKDQGNRIMLVLKDPDSAMSIAAKQVVASFFNHMDLLSKDNKGKIRVTIKEVSPRKGR